MILNYSMSIADAYALFCCTSLVMAFLWITLKGKESWPFSCYPMFSKPIIASENMAYYRIALESENGAIDWWKPSFPRHQRRVSLILEKASLDMESKDSIETKQRCLTELVKLLNREQPEHKHIAICIYLRRMVNNDNGALSIDNELAERITLPLLKS